jgi:hypothetical protein
MSTCACITANSGASYGNYASAHHAYHPPLRIIEAYVVPDPVYRAIEGIQDPVEYSIACPYRCGRVLTGVHAVGNLTRHLKSEGCSASGRAKPKYTCPIEGCRSEYNRSDGLRVHLRRRHGAPPAQPRSATPIDGGDIDK